MDHTHPTFDENQIVPGRSELPPADYIDATRQLYAGLGYDDYRWAERPDPAPWAPITKPLRDCNVMLVGSGGVYRRGQIAFHTKDDTSIRLIPSDTDASELRTAHFAYDQTDARDDPNCVFPLDPLRALVADGTIGGLTEQSIAFMGGIYSTRRMEESTAQLIVDQCHAETPDIVLLVPV